MFEDYRHTYRYLLYAPAFNLQDQTTFENFLSPIASALIPSPIEESLQTQAPGSAEEESKSIVDALLRRVRYLLTLQGHAHPSSILVRNIVGWAQHFIVPTRAR